MVCGVAEHFVGLNGHGGKDLCAVEFALFAIAHDAVEEARGAFFGGHLRDVDTARPAAAAHPTGERCGGGAFGERRGVGRRVALIGELLADEIGDHSQHRDTRYCPGERMAREGAALGGAVTSGGAAVLTEAGAGDNGAVTFAAGGGGDGGTALDTEFSGGGFAAAGAGHGVRACHSKKNTPEKRLPEVPPPPDISLSGVGRRVHPSRNYRKERTWPDPHVLC